MTKSMYDSYLLDRSGPLRIVKIQTNDTLILVNNNFTSNEEKTIKVTKLMTKDCKHLIPSQPIKFNGA